MRHHEFVIELPFSAERIWALFQRYDLWKEYAPSVLDVEIVYPGDREGNGLVRKVIYPLPFGRRGESFESGDQRHTKPRIRLSDAAYRSEWVNDAGATRPRAHAHSFPRVVPHDNAAAAPFRSSYLSVHQ